MTDTRTALSALSKLGTDMQALITEYEKQYPGIRVTDIEAVWHLVPGEGLVISAITPTITVRKPQC